MLRQRLCSTAAGWFLIANVLSEFCQVQPVESLEWKRAKQLEAALHEESGVFEFFELLLARARGRRRVRDSPVGDDRLAGPVGTGFASVVKDGYHEIKLNVLELF